MQAAARSLGLQLAVLEASTQSEIDAAFAGLVRHKVDALLINTDPFLLGQREQIVQLAARTNVPAMYFLSDFVDAGGLMSYGPKVANSYRQVGIYVGRILKGEKIGELPFVLPTRFDLVINLRTARALGLEIPSPGDDFVAMQEAQIRPESEAGRDRWQESMRAMVASRRRRR